MRLFRKLLHSCYLFTLVAGLSACSTVVFPELDTQTDPVLSSEDQEQKMIAEGKALGSDEKNIAYSDEAPAKHIKKIEAAEVVPVEEEKFASHEVEAPVIEPIAEDIQPIATAPSVSYKLDTFYFDNGSSTLGSKYNAQIREAVKLAKKHNATIKIYGYSSSRTRNTDPISHKLANFEVSMKRAESVASALIRAGLSKSKISIEALGDNNPAYLEVMPEGERLNRRAEVYISY